MHGVSGQGRRPGRLCHGVSGQGRCPGRQLGLGLGFGFVFVFVLAFRVEKQNIGSSRNRNPVAVSSQGRCPGRLCIYLYFTRVDSNRMSTMTFSNARDFFKMCMSVHNETDSFSSVVARTGAIKLVMADT